MLVQNGGVRSAKLSKIIRLQELPGLNDCNNCSLSDFMNDNMMKRGKVTLDEWKAGHKIYHLVTVNQEWLLKNSLRYLG